MSTELIVKDVEPGVYETTLEHILKTLVQIDDMPYWSLDLMEDWKFGLGEFSKWTPENGYRIFIDISEERQVERFYVAKPDGHDVKWWAIRGTSWALNIPNRRSGIKYDEYMGVSWPDDATVMMHGTWNDVRYFNIKEAVGYDCERFVEEMSRDIQTLSKIFFSLEGTIFLKTPLPHFPVRVE
ncbi:hypothetical protein pEaSNUABM29_00101 [Erwinia phage pEa_SNUABM_29]|nr:hypothetical protein pEaSNUABM29_00101 [Erwinia phage pEa_SNUABM_29]